MIFYAIRHKASGELMPQMKRDRGYTHWNPSDKNKQLTLKLDIPRLFSTLKKANKCASLWCSQPNLAQRYTSATHLGGEDWSTDIRPDGRKREDIEIVVLHVRIASK